MITTVQSLLALSVLPMVTLLALGLPYDPALENARRTTFDVKGSTAGRCTSDSRITVERIRGFTAGSTVTAVFQQGTDGYVGTVDTYLSEQSPANSNGSLDNFEWDESWGTSGQETLALLRFDELFGASPGQIPAGAEITSAMLTLTVFDAGDYGELREVLVGWDESVTYDDFGGDPGAQPDEYGAIVDLVPGSVGVQTIDVTASLQSWMASPSSNNGWIVLHTATNGVQVWSSEAANVVDRPTLTVDYSYQIVCQDDTGCDNGDFCDGAEICVGELCQAGSRPCPNQDCDETNDECVPLGVLKSTEEISGPPNQYRWKDIAGNVYVATYQASYDYSQASGSVQHAGSSDTFEGTLSATNLKPNFAYQMKIVANPEGKYVADLTPAEYQTLHNIASIGRWWDLTTGQINPPYNPDHQMQSYLLFDHVETNNLGEAMRLFRADSSFHVLFTTDQTGGLYDLVTTTVNPAGPPQNDWAYSSAAYPGAVDVTVGAQNEQGTVGSTFLPAGHYEGVKFVLTEESFHESCADVCGWWASAMAAWIEFDITCTNDVDCDDGVDCTWDVCAGGLCSFISDDGNCPDNSVFCDGLEYCDMTLGCVSTGDPCSPLTCDENSDQCGGCLSDAECDDGDPCTMDSCAGGACVSDGLPDGTPCPDGLFCNGEETCQSGECSAGVPSCSDACQLCDEAGDVCVWCILDVDRNGWIGSGDFGAFAGCYGQCYSPGDPCLGANFDASPDGCVGSGDFGGFAGCYTKSCSECSNCVSAQPAGERNERY